MVNRNINFTNVCYVGCRFCAFAQREVDPSPTRSRSRRSPTGPRRRGRAGRHRGVHAGRASTPTCPGEFYFDLLDAVKAACPDPHPRVQPDGGAERRPPGWASRSGSSSQECRRHGLGSIPGTAAEILDDDVRWVLTKGKLPADTWEEIVRTAHDVGIRSSSTIMYGHVDAPPHWVAHIRRLGADPARHRRVHGVRPAAVRPSERADLPRGEGASRPDVRRNRRMHAVARILLHGVDPQRAGLVGEAGHRGVSGDPAGRGERLRRHA